jgi:uncharacterized membrane protein
MFVQYESVVKAAIVFLRLLGIKVNNVTVNETLQNHPDWPSLLCVSDSLWKWNVPNAAGRVGKDDIDQLPLPFVAHLQNNFYPLAIVKEVTATEIGYFTKEYNKYTLEKKEDFLKKWDGVYLIAEINESSGEVDYRKVKQKSFIQSLIPVALFLLLGILSIYFFFGRIRENSLIYTVAVYFQFLILLAGVSVTALLLWYEVDRNNILLQKVCTGLSKTNCNAVLTSSQAKLFSWLSWSEIGFIYFSGGLLTFLLGFGTLASTIEILAWLSLLALPYTVFSIWYQWRVAKQWCVLCLAVQFLLVAAAVISVTSGLLRNSFYFSFNQIACAVVLYIFPALIWKCLKPYIQKLQQAKNTKREYLRMKFNPEVFDMLLKRQTPLALPVEGLGIHIGKPDAPNTFIKICNPYCGPCSKAHPKIEELLEKHDNLQVKIIFTASNDDNDIAAKPVRHLMAIAEGGNEVITKQALDDWYLPAEIDYDEFAARHPINGELAKQGARLEAMAAWCEGMKVTSTPTFFFNGYRLPDAYEIEDLKYFLLE